MSNADTIEISEADFPALYQDADHNSLKSQAHFLLATRLRLALLVAAALFGGIRWLVDGTDLAGVIAAVAFGGALVTELYLLKSQPERSWYDGRAVAESAKTLTWRYLVGGAPLDIRGNTADQADEILVRRLDEVVHELPGNHLVPVTDMSEQITAVMRHARAQPLQGRRDLYLRGRIRDQATWYSMKARWNASRANAWRTGMAFAEAAGLTVAILKAVKLIQIDLLGLIGALVAAGAAWLQTKQHDALSRAYSVAAHELKEIASRINVPKSEDEWSRFVDQAEEAISREHTLWRASHA